MNPAVDEYLDAWRLSAAEYDLSVAKISANQLDFALLLKCFQIAGRFPSATSAIEAEVIACVARQLGADPGTVGTMGGRTLERARADIRNFCGFREATVDDAERLTDWIFNHIAATSLRSHDGLVTALEGECRERRIEPPAPERIDRIVRSAARAHEERFCNATVARLSAVSRSRLDALLRPAAAVDSDDADDHSIDPDVDAAATMPAATASPRGTVITQLRSDAGRPSVNSLCSEMAKLETLRELELPADLFDGTSPHELESYRKRVGAEEPYELRRHPENARLTWLAVFAALRSRAVTDTLVDLLVETIHHINARAERRVEHELLEDLRRVSGKQNLLFQVADAALTHPDGIVRDVVFPIVNEGTLRTLVREWKASGPSYRSTLRAFIRNSYKSHYRKMVPQLLRTLEFRSNNELHQPVIRALDLLKRYAECKFPFYPADEDVPLDFVRGLWREAVIDDIGDDRSRVNRITYEICVLEALREQLRCKEIWVVGADRYRNPDEDVPADFESQRVAYYAALRLPRDADVFIDGLRNEMREALRALNDNLPHNPSVTVSSKAGGWIALSPLGAQPEPENVAALKAEVGSLWPMTSLLDMLKETDLRLNFTDALRSVTSHEILDHETLRLRLLLCLHGIGTNAGLQRMNPAAHGATYKDLVYVRRRYITVDQLRTAIGIITNGTASRSQFGDLGRRNGSVCLRLEALRRLGPKPHDAMAPSLRRSRNHDLLACRA